MRLRSRLGSAAVFRRCCTSIYGAGRRPRQTARADAHSARADLRPAKGRGNRSPTATALRDGRVCIRAAPLGPRSPKVSPVFRHPNSEALRAGRGPPRLPRIAWHRAPLPSWRRRALPLHAAALRTPARIVRAGMRFWGQGGRRAAGLRAPLSCFAMPAPRSGSVSLRRPSALKASTFGHLLSRREIEKRAFRCCCGDPSAAAC